MSADVYRTGRVKTSSSSDNRWHRLVENELASTGYPSRDRIFASSAGLCERQTAGLILLKDGHEDKMKASSQFYFAIGSAFEDVMKRAFQRGGVYVSSEVRVEAPYDWLPVSGRIDFILKDPFDNEPTLVELKSCGKLPTEPKHPHLAQLLVYMLITGMRRGVVWYVSRNVSDWTGEVHQVAFDIIPTKAQLLRAARALVRGAVFAASNKIPAIPEHMRKYKCGFCPLVPYCWNDEPLELDGEHPSVTENYELLEESEKKVEKLMADTHLFRNQLFRRFDSLPDPSS